METKKSLGPLIGDGSFDAPTTRYGIVDPQTLAAPRVPIRRLLFLRPEARPMIGLPVFGLANERVIGDWIGAAWTALSPARPRTSFAKRACLIRRFLPVGWPNKETPQFSFDDVEDEARPVMNKRKRKRDTYIENEWGKKVLLCIGKKEKKWFLINDQMRDKPKTGKRSNV